PDGLIRPVGEVPKEPSDLPPVKWELEEREFQEAQTPQRTLAQEDPVHAHRQGVNILKAIKDFEVALKINDKGGIQKAIDHLDLALQQVTQARAQVGARLNALQLHWDSLQKNQLDNKIMTSQLEDVDLFQLVSDMSKSETTLKATMESSSRLVQPSLLDFLK
ncbi:MAG: flagellin, partial [Bdellovibrionaceae bacterium]|nr:flagellin [Pseudobdellovibrionaceae bacterium]